MTSLLDQQYLLGDSVKFYPMKNLLIYDQEEININPQESQVLRLLCLNANKVVLRSEIISTIWADNYLVGDKGLNRVICELRKTLKECDQKHLEINTVVKTGYRLIGEVKSPATHNRSSTVPGKLANHGYIYFSALVIAFLLWSYSSILPTDSGDDQAHHTLVIEGEVRDIYSRESSYFFSKHTTLGNFDIYFADNPSLKNAKRLTDTTTYNELNPLYFPAHESIVFVRSNNNSQESCQLIKMSLVDFSQKAIGHCNMRPFSPIVLMDDSTIGYFNNNDIFTFKNIINQETELLDLKGIKLHKKLVAKLGDSLFFVQINKPGQPKLLTYDLKYKSLKTHDYPYAIADIIAVDNTITILGIDSQKIVVSTSALENLPDYHHEIKKILK